VSDVGIERIMVGKFVCGCTWAQNIDQVQWRYQVIELPHVSNLHNNELLNTVEPPNKGHFGSRAFVLFSEVVLWWEVRTNMPPQDLTYLDSMY